MLHPTPSQVPAKRAYPTDEGLGTSLHWMNPETSAQPRATKKSKARREGPLDAITKANAYLVKKIGACWLCRSQRGGKVCSFKYTVSLTRRSPFPSVAKTLSCPAKHAKTEMSREYGAMFPAGESL